jgi:hypothetical protein
MNAQFWPLAKSEIIKINSFYGNVVKALARMPDRKSIAAAALSRNKARLSSGTGVVSNFWTSSKETKTFSKKFAVGVAAAKYQSTKWEGCSFHEDM